MTNDALKLTSLASRCLPSRLSTARVASDTQVTASNIVRAVHRLHLPSSTSPRCLRMLITACVPARFPELRSTMTRSPSRSNTVILQNFDTLSSPALVRESDAKIMPLSRRTPTQYVMGPYYLLAHTSQK